MPLDHVRVEGRAGRMGAQMMAIVAEGKRGRIYLPPDHEHERVAANVKPLWIPEAELVYNPRYLTPPNYGLDTFAKLFSPLQLATLAIFIELRAQVYTSITQIAEPTYAAAVTTFLAFAVDRGAESWCSLSRWQSTGDKVAGAFSRQALSMLWDYAEVNPFSESTRNFLDAVAWVAKTLDPLPALGGGTVALHNASAHLDNTNIVRTLISTDPPYYDNVPYADLSDFFYVWLRPMLKDLYPDLFETLLVPKSQELVADPFRHGGREKAQHFFEEGLKKAFLQMHKLHSAKYPLTVYYAFKQAEEENEDEDYPDSQSDSATKSSIIASTGWETMLEGLITSGFAINGTWPMRTERSARTRSLGSNALATSIVLVCRPRPEDARSTTRLEFIRLLRRELPEALRALQHANIAPVDLAQAAIGPGMAIYSRFKAVLEADGTPMRVRTALQLINQALDEVLAEQEGTYDTDTRWAIAWFEQHAFDEGAYGIAETLSKAKNTSVQGMVEAGVVQARAGRVRLLRRDELSRDWNPAADTRLTAWEATQQLVHALDQRGEQGAAKLLAALPGSLADIARDLAYRLYTTCERKKWAPEALCYNALVVAWPEISRLAAMLSHGEAVQHGLF